MVLQYILILCNFVIITATELVHPYSLSDLDRLKEESMEGARMGFTGTFVIMLHNRGVAMGNSPSPHTHFFLKQFW
jgi:hypothetical protein